MRSAFTSSVIAIGFLAIGPVAAPRQTTAPARTADGRPNLQGIWQVLNTAAWDLQERRAGKGSAIFKTFPTQAISSIITGKLGEGGMRVRYQSDVKGA